VTEALTRTGRSAPADAVASICHDIEVAAALDEAIELERTIDTSVEALMVGDRASHDGGGVKAGIATLLVSPPATAHEPNGLDRVVRLVG
jgi:hypothetical protein